MLTEEQITKSLQSAGCTGVVRMSFESGPYCIDRPTIKADNFARAIESAACAERDARIAELTRELEEARKDAESLTDEQIEAAVKAWFQEKIVPGKFPFHKRMRAAIRAAIKEQT